MTIKMKMINKTKRMIESLNCFAFEEENIIFLEMHDKVFY